MSEENHHHVIPLKYTIRTFLTLLVLTVVTVAAALVDFSEFNKYLPRNMDLHPLNNVIAMVIAIVKGSLVLAFFMGLAWDKMLNKAIVLMNVLLVLVLFGFTLTDTLFRDVPDALEGQKLLYDSPVLKAKNNPTGQHGGAGSHSEDDPDSEEEAPVHHEPEEEFVEDQSEVIMEVDSAALDSPADSTAQAPADAAAKTSTAH